MKLIKKTNDYISELDVGPDANVRLITADNGNAYTHTGTNTYLIGKQNLAILDPGPNLASHLKNIRFGIGTSSVSHIFITHSHQDHCALALELAEKTGATIYLWDEFNHSDIDLIKRIEDKSVKAHKNLRKNFSIKIQRVKDGDEIFNNEWCLEIISTPGHMFDHICLSLKGVNVIFSGDHVMGWSSSVIIPPLGDMTNFLASLRKVLNRHENLYFPAHGPPIINAKDYVKLQLRHRENRERQIVKLIELNPSTPKELRRVLYPKINAYLIEAAEHNIYAHLLDLIKRKLVSSDGKPSIQSVFFMRAS